MYRSGGFLSSSDRPSDLIGRGSRREDGDDDLSSSSSSPSIAGSRSRSSGGSATISWQLQCLAASVPRRVLEGMKDKVQCSSDVARDSSTSGGDAFACSGQECACLFIDVSGFTRSMELFAQWGGRGIERFWHIVNSYFGGLLQEAYCRGGDVECFAGDAMLITFRSLRVLEEATVLAISQAVWASNPPPGDWSLQLATLLCVDAAVSMLSTYSPYAITEAGFTDQQGTPLKLSLDIHGAIVAGTLDFSEHRLCGDKRSGAWYFVSGPIMEELGVTHDFSKRGQCVLGPSAVRALQPWAVKLSGDPKSDIGQVWKVPRPSESSSFSKCLIIGAKGSIPPPLLLSVGALMPPGASELPFQWPVVSILGAISAAGFDQQSQAILTDALVKYVPSTFVERLEQELATGLASESDKLDTSGRRISLASAHSRSVRNPSLPSSLPPLKPSTSNTKKRNIVKNYIWGGTRGSQSVSSTRSSTLSASTYHPHSGKQSRQTMLGELRQATVAFVKFDTGALNTPESVCITSGHSPYSPLQISPPSSPTYASPLPSRMIFSPGRDRLVSLKPGPQSKALERLWLSAAAAEALPSNETPAQHERRGFTRLSLLERVGKDCIKAADAVLELGGQVNKIIMDDKGLSLLYAFGTPGCSYEDNVARALQVALKIQEGVLESGNGGWRFGVGISSGEVCVGLLGLSSVRCEYALVGATVNMAARLASQAQAGEWGVLTEPSTVEQIVRNGGLVGAKAEFMLGMGMKAVSVGVMRLKGQAADTTLFEVVKSTTLAHSAATLNGGIGSSQPSNTALIGRMRQLSRLLGRLQIDGAAKPPAPSSCCRSTIVEGGPGMGKTTLLRHAWSLLSSSLPTEENRGRRVSLDSKGLEYSTPEGANRGCALVYHCCSHPDRLQPLSTVSGLARQIVDICRGFEADGSVLYEKLARLIGERERQLLPLLSKLGITLKYSDARSPNPVRSRESSLLQATERRSILNMLRSASGSGSAFSLHDSGNATMRGHYHELPPWELSKQLACLTVALLTAAQQNAAVEQIIVVVDDLHHSDRGSMEILLHMLQGEQSPEYASGNPSSVSFVFSSRDARYWGSQGEHWYLRLRSLPSIERIVLEPLSARQVSRLACAELDCEGLSPELEDMLVRRCMGIPLFVKEVCRSLTVQDVIEMKSIKLKPPPLKTKRGEVSSSKSDSSQQQQLSHEGPSVPGDSPQLYEEAGDMTGLSKSALSNYSGPLSDPSTRSGSGGKGATESTSGDVFSLHDMSDDDDDDDGENPWTAPRVFAFLRVTSGNSSSFTVPQGLADVLGAAIDRLDPVLSYVVKVASVVGEEFTPELLLAVMPNSMDAGLLLDCLRRLCTERIITWRADEQPALRQSYRFTHTNMWHACHGTLLHKQRRLLHLAVAAALQNLRRLEGDSSDAAEVSVAQHLLAATTTAPSADELGDLGGWEGYAELVKSTLIAVASLLTSILLPRGLYIDAKAYLAQGMNLLSYWRALLADRVAVGIDIDSSSSDLDALDFSLSMSYCKVEHFLRGSDAPETVRWLDRAIALTSDERIGSGALISAEEVLRSRLYKSNRFMAQGNLVEAKEILLPYMIGGTMDMSRMRSGASRFHGRKLQYEICAHLAGNALLAGDLVDCERCCSCISTWRGEAPLCLAAVEPIAMLIGCGMLARGVMRADQVVYGNELKAFIKYSALAHPYHLWQVMSWIGLIWAALGEFEGLYQAFTSVKTAVPERFRASNAKVEWRIAIVDIVCQIYKASDELDTLCGRRGIALTFEAHGIRGGVETANADHMQALLENAQKLLDQLLLAIQEESSPIMCLVAFRAAMILHSSPHAQAAIDCWERCEGSRSDENAGITRAVANFDTPLTKLSLPLCKAALEMQHMSNEIALQARLGLPRKMQDVETGSVNEASAAVFGEESKTSAEQKADCLLPGDNPAEDHKPNGNEGDWEEEKSVVGKNVNTLDEDAGSFDRQDERKQEQPKATVDDKDCPNPNESESSLEKRVDRLVIMLKSIIFRSRESGYWLAEVQGMMLLARAHLIQGSTDEAYSVMGPIRTLLEFYRSNGLCGPEGEFSLSILNRASDLINDLEAKRANASSLTTGIFTCTKYLWSLREVFLEPWAVYGEALEVEEDQYLPPWIKNPYLRSLKDFFLSPFGPMGYEVDTTDRGLLIRKSMRASNDDLLKVESIVMQRLDDMHAPGVAVEERRVDNDPV